MLITSVVPDRRPETQACRQCHANDGSWQTGRFLRHGTAPQDEIPLRASISDPRQEFGFVKREIAGSHGATLWFSDNHGRGANYATSMEMLGKAHLTPLDDHPALSILMGNRGLTIELRDSWFYLRNGASNNGLFVLLDDDYHELRRAWHRYAEHTVYFSNGGMEANANGPFSLGINPDIATRHHGWRYVVYSANRETDVVPLVVGIEDRLQP